LIKEQIRAGVTDEDAQEPGVVIADANEAQKDYWCEVLLQLTNSHRFNTFVEDNFEIQTFINDEEKTIDTRVIERPVSVGPPLSSGQLQEVRTILSLAGCNHPEAVFTAILKTLGQDAPEIILETKL